MSAIEALLLFLAFILTGACGARFYNQLGIWGMLPTIGLGLILAVVLIADVVRTMRESVDARRRKEHPTERR